MERERRQVRQEGHDAGGDIGSTSAADERLLATVTTDVDNGEGNEAEKNNNNLEMRRSSWSSYGDYFFGRRLSCYDLIQSSFVASLVMVFLTLGHAQAVAECMSGGRVRCFECNSHTDPSCGDPFNWSMPLPPVNNCEGCCVKMVQGIGTPDMKIRRGCTDDIDINMFMVDHVCMSEGGGKGRMCFCEENECNGAVSPNSSPATALLAAMAIWAVMAALINQGGGGNMRRQQTRLWVNNNACHNTYRVPQRGFS